MSKQRKSSISQNEQSKATHVERLAAYLIRRQKSIAILISLITVVIVGVFLWYRYQEQKVTAAQSEMYQAIYEFEADNFEKALTGDEGYAGFLDIIKDYRYTKAANLAHLYAGIIYIRQANYKEAITYLQRFKAADYLLQARAWSLIGDAYSQQQDYNQASAYYMKAADYQPNEFFTPVYLSKAATAYEAHGKYQAARQCYERIIQNYPQSPWYEEARKHSSRLENLS
jgi:tetratricopeptide (TPR) repeat protein